MKKILLLVILFLSCFAYAQDPSTLVHSQTSYVNDFDGVFTEPQKHDLDAMMRSFHDTVQMTIVTVHSLNGLEPYEYAVKVGNNWGVGSHSNNGLLILICVPEHQFFAATGPGIQGDLTDLKCGEYYREIAKPLYKEGNYYDGTKAVLAKYIDELSPAAKALREKQEQEEAVYNRKKTEEMMSGVGYFITGLIVVILAILGIRRYVRKKEDEERRKQAIKEQAVRDFAKLKDRYLTCYQEIQKLVQTLQTCPFKDEVAIINENIKRLIPTAFVADPEKAFMEKYIEDYNTTLSKVSPLIKDVNDKSKILSEAKKVIDQKLSSGTTITELTNRLSSLTFNLDKVDYSPKINSLRTLVTALNENFAKIVQAYNTYNVAVLPDLMSLQTKYKRDYDMVFNDISSIIKADDDKIRIGKTGKETILSKISQYRAYCGKVGVSAAASADTEKQCNELTARINEKFTNDVVYNYAMYNFFINQLSLLTKAKQEYDAEQDRLRRIREEEERKRREKEEEERRKRREKEEEERKARRKREQDEEDDRRRNSSSSYSSYSSSSNNDSGGGVSFGGGSFDGGGGGGSW